MQGECSSTARLNPSPGKTLGNGCIGKRFFKQMMRGRFLQACRRPAMRASCSSVREKSRRIAGACAKSKLEVLIWEQPQPDRLSHFTHGESPPSQLGHHAGLSIIRKMLA